ncbi:MAG: lipocalin family protein [Bacteroidota bacterium]|nr:lipocalin family protein [Bacteroidota bacterium]
MVSLIEPPQPAKQASPMINAANSSFLLRCNTLYYNSLVISTIIPSFICKGWVIARIFFYTIPNHPGCGGGTVIKPFSLPKTKRMKVNFMKWALIAVTSGAMVLSCKKEKSNSTQCPTTMAGLSGSYKLTALQYKPGPSAAPVDYFASLDDCEKDDILILKSDGTYDYDDAGTVCNPDGTDHGNWRSDGNALISDGLFNGTIISYDCTTLVFYTQNAIKAGDKLTYTMVKQ